MDPDQPGPGLEGRGMPGVAVPAREPRIRPTLPARSARNRAGAPHDSWLDGGAEQSRNRLAAVHTGTAAPQRCRSIEAHLDAAALLLPQHGLHAYSVLLQLLQVIATALLRHQRLCNPAMAAGTIHRVKHHRVHFRHCPWNLERRWCEDVHQPLVAIPPPVRVVVPAPIRCDAPTTRLVADPHLV